MLEEQVVSTREDNETGSGDACGQLATRLEGSYDVVPHMHDKRRRLHFGQKISDIEIADRRRNIELRTRERSFSDIAR